MIPAQRNLPRQYVRAHVRTQLRGELYSMIDSIEARNLNLQVIRELSSLDKDLKRIWVLTRKSGYGQKVALQAINGSQCLEDMVDINKDIIKKEQEIWAKMTTRGKGNRNDQGGRGYGRGSGYGNRYGAETDGGEEPTVVSLAGATVATTSDYWDNQIMIPIITINRTKRNQNTLIFGRNIKATRRHRHVAASSILLQTIDGTAGGRPLTTYKSTRATPRPASTNFPKLQGN
eukprot:gene21340-8115_t